jgi:hypothetical protein
MTLGTAASSVVAYIGPGAGLTLIGSFIGLCLAVLAAFGAILAWPIRRLLKRRRAPEESSGAEDGPDAV